MFNLFLKFREKIKKRAAAPGILPEMTAPLMKKAVGKS